MVGQDRALDIILTGRQVMAEEALAHEIARFPRECMREAMREEYWYGQSCLKNEGVAGAARFKRGKGRHGDYKDI